MTKKKIKETQYLSIEDFEGSIDEVIARLQEIKEDGWEGLEVNYHYESTSYNKSYNKYKHRLETDGEYTSRLYAEELSKNKRREHYLRLKKEFGDE